MTYALWCLSFQDDTSNSFSPALVKSRSSLTLLCCPPFINEPRPTNSEHQYSLNPLNITLRSLWTCLLRRANIYSGAAEISRTNRIWLFPRFMFSVALHDVPLECVSRQIRTEVSPRRGQDSVHSCLTRRHSPQPQLHVVCTKP